MSKSYILMKPKNYLDIIEILNKRIVIDKEITLYTLFLLIEKELVTPSEGEIQSIIKKLVDIGYLKDISKPKVFDGVYFEIAPISIQRKLKLKEIFGDSIS